MKNKYGNADELIAIKKTITSEEVDIMVNLLKENIITIDDLFVGGRMWPVEDQDALTKDEIDKNFLEFMIMGYYIKEMGDDEFFKAYQNMFANIPKELVQKGVLLYVMAKDKYTGVDDRLNQLFS